MGRFPILRKMSVKKKKFSRNVEKWENCGMIMLTKLNNEKIILNSAQIEAIEFIPEAKIIMMNGKFYIVREDAEEIIEKTIEYNGRVRNYVNQ